MPHNISGTWRDIRHLARELHGVAAQSRFAFLAYLLKMAEEEAASLTERLEGKEPP
jgi:hypothetical protein